MTSALRRKHPTTRSNMLRWTFDRIRVVGSLTGVLLLSVPRPGIADGIDKHLRRVGTSRTESAKSASGKLPPLERLKARSALARWESFKKTTREGLKTLHSLEGARNELRPLPQLKSTPPDRTVPLPPEVEVLESPADGQVTVPLPHEPPLERTNPVETFLPFLEPEVPLPVAEQLET